MPLKTNVVILFVGAIGAVAVLYAYFYEGGTTAGADPSDGKLVALGQEVYRENCAVCHGANLQGQPSWRTRNDDGTLPAPPHDQTGHTWHHPDQVLFEYTKKGGAALAPPSFKSAMPGFEETLKDGEIWAVLAFIKSRWPEQVRKQQNRITEQSR